MNPIRRLYLRCHVRWHVTVFYFYFWRATGHMSWSLVKRWWQRLPP